MVKEGSSATDFVTDVTDVTDFIPMEVGRSATDSLHGCNGCNGFHSDGSRKKEMQTAVETDSTKTKSLSKRLKKIM